RREDASHLAGCPPAPCRPGPERERAARCRHRNDCYIARMSASKDRKALPVLGSLGELFSSVRTDPEDLPRAPLQPRVLLCEEPRGKALVLLCWEDPGGPGRLHSALRKRIEGALLAELGYTPAEAREGARLANILRLLSFAPLEGDIEPALRPFGLSPVSVT